MPSEDTSGFNFDFVDGLEAREEDEANLVRDDNEVDEGVGFEEG